LYININIGILKIGNNTIKVNMVYTCFMGQLKNDPEKTFPDLLKFAFLFFCLSLLAGCTGVKNVLPTEENRFSGSVSVPLPARHLVFIGLDGWSGAYMSKANMPTVKRMMAAGASSLYMQCVMPSSSLPNWTVLFSGTPLEQQNREPFPSIFSLVNDSAGKNSAVLFYQSTDFQKLPFFENVETRIISSDLESAKLIASCIAEMKPVFTAIVFDEPDATGHKKRWGSNAYYTKLSEMDNLIAHIEMAVKDAGIYDDTAFVLSADHGGAFWGHGQNTSKQRRIPIVIYGNMIKNGYAIPESLGIYDVAPTMAAILGLKAPPEWTGRIIPGIYK